jgi:predicted DNA-binding transcriptional regulator AlpA
MAKPRASDDPPPEPVYTLTELRTKLGIRLSNEQLLMMLLTGHFPQPHRKAGRWVWSLSEVTVWLISRMRAARNEKWNIIDTYKSDVPLTARLKHQTDLHLRRHLKTLEKEKRRRRRAALNDQQGL